MQSYFISLGSRITANSDAVMDLKDAPWKKNCDRPRQHIQKQRHHFANKGLYSQNCWFFQQSCTEVSWTLMKAECRRIDAFNMWFWRRLLRVSYSKKIKPVYPRRYQPWIFIGRIVAEAEAETPILWLLDAKNWLIGKDPDAWKDWGQEEKGITEDELVGWHHWLNGHEFEQLKLRVGDGQESLTCWSPWGGKESDTTEWLNWTELKTYYQALQWAAASFLKVILKVFQALYFLP